MWAKIKRAIYHKKMKKGNITYKIFGIPVSSKKQLPVFQDNGKNNLLIITNNNRKNKYYLIPGNNYIVDGLEIFVSEKAMNNLIQIDVSNSFQSSYFYISGKNSTLCCGIKNKYRKFLVFMNESTDGACLKIEKEIRMGGCQIDLFGKDSVEINEYCMFSYDIHIWAGDGHAIYEEKTKKLLNGKQSTVKIGKYCWIGNQVVLTKNAKISDNSIVGVGSVVTKSFEKPNVIIAGNPAKIIKEGENWAGCSPNEYKDPSF